METYISQGADALIGETTYDVKTSVSGRDILVSGTAASDTEKAAILANLDTTDGRRVVVDDLKLINIASPYMFKGSKAASGVSYSGNAPTSDALAGYVSADNLSLAGGMPDENWPAFVGLGAQGISILENGSFEISDRSISVTGLAGSLEEEAVVKDLFASLPEGYSASIDLDVAPTVPYIFNGSRTADGESYSGYVASAAERGTFTGLIGDAAQGLTPTAGMPDANWPSVVGVGIKALKGLNTGELSVVDKTLTLTGEVNTPSAVDTIKGMFAAMPEGYSANVNLAPLDDGAPASLDFDWVAGQTAKIEGKGPDGVALDDLTAALNLPKLDGTFRQGKVAGKDSILSRFAGIGAALPMLESASATVSADATAFTGVLLPGGDMDSVQATLADGLGSNSSIALTRSALEPKEGDLRVNADTGKNEIYQNGFWMVVPEPEPVVVEPAPEPEPVVEEVVVVAPKISALERCVSQTNAIMKTTKISYETASANLTADSIEELSDLGAVLKDCAGVEGLSVEVGGHTDSQGSDEFNQDLSQKRANSVRSALITLGVSDTAISAKGYGEADPIATNETEEGRAQNRRTTFTWTVN